MVPFWGLAAAGEADRVGAAELVQFGGPRLDEWPDLVTRLRAGPGGLAEQHGGGGMVAVEGARPSSLAAHPVT